MITQEERIVPRPQVLERVGVNHVTLWRMEKRGEFPKHIQVSPGRIGYLASEVDNWIASRAAARKDRA